MAEHIPVHDDELVAELSDLLEVDRDAVAAYDVAIDRLRNEAFRSWLRAFRADRERHIADLSGLLGGAPERGAAGPGPFEAAVREVGPTGGDRELLLAFRVHEARARDLYRRAAAVPRHPEVEAVLRRNAADEERHYAWVTQALEALGAGPATAAADAPARAASVEAPERTPEPAEDGGAVEAAAPVAPAGARAAHRAEARGAAVRRVAPRARGLADARRAQGLAAIRDDVENEVLRHPIRSVLVAAGIGYVVGRLIR
ncbi:MAG: ferritin-like domain-containing protein [Gemmatimonadetes bacterium]|nr:ferritin-like domain-containing protein [Gemmatimonadota bacterium]